VSGSAPAMLRGVPGLIEHDAPQSTAASPRLLLPPSASHRHLSRAAAEAHYGAVPP
jgi:hypothetical protein